MIEVRGLLSGRKGAVRPLLGNVSSGVFVREIEGLSEVGKWGGFRRGVDLGTF